MIVEAATALDQLFAPWNRTDAPGLTVGVALNDELVYRRGFGMASLESGLANTPRTRMRIGSTTKHFTALLALLLAEDGRLDLDLPIRHYLPELSGPGGEPRLRLLLQHRGGSRCYLDLGFIGHGMAMPPRGRTVAMQTRQQGRNFAAGEGFIYNNGGYELVSLAIARAGGAPFAELLKRRLFDPLGMADTLLLQSDFAITPGMATLHVPDGDGWRRGIFPSEEMLGAGGIVSTVDDMLRWAVHLRRRDRFGSPSTWHALTETPIFPDGSHGSYALGLMNGSYRGARVVHHAGGVIGGSSQMLTFPDHGLDVVILSNGAPAADPMALAERVADIVLAGRLEAAVAPAPLATTHARWLGHWWSAQTGMVYGLRDDGGALKASICGTEVGLPFVDDGGGRARLAPQSLGEITVQLGDGDPSEGLPIRFGGVTSPYRRVQGETVDVASFCAAVLGRYASADGDCVAEFTRDGTGAALTLSDACGAWAHSVEPLGDTVALCKSRVGGLPFGMALTFTKTGGRMTGFRLATTRTRDLAFVRVGEA
jgi:CubicO group peptidase (beta-lactamase class C family)